MNRDEVMQTLELRSYDKYNFFKHSQTVMVSMQLSLYAANVNVKYVHYEPSISVGVLAMFRWSIPRLYHAAIVGLQLQASAGC